MFDMTPEIPNDLKAALEASPSALAAWDNLTDIGRRDFISWINEAKQAETRERRITRCAENLTKGKKRPCCYAVVPMDLYRALGDNPEAKTKWSSLSANEKRDFSDWVEDSADKAQRKERIALACGTLTSGKSQPPE